MTLLRTKQLTVMAGQRVLCRELDLTVRAGEVWGILGPNGCGKTTLLHTLAGLREASSGEILLADQALRSLSRKAIAQSVGLLFQDMHVVFAQSVFAYCLGARYPHRAYFQRETCDDDVLVSQALAVMELTHLAAAPITQLSGGEKRRLAIASLLVQAPQLYLLDEPTNHLDVRHQMRALHHFHHLATTSSAVVMTLHDVNLAQRFCQQLLLLFADGRTQQGATSDLLTEDNVQQLYQSPMKRIQQADHHYWLPI